MLIIEKNRDLTRKKSYSSLQKKNKDPKTKLFESQVIFLGIDT